MLNILVIEDNVEELNYLCGAINSVLEECRILKAKSGEEALLLMTQKKIDIFFVDVELPGMNGFQLAGQIRRNMNYILTNIVFITGYKANQLRIHKKYHHYEYIEKPYTLNFFESAVGIMLQELDHQKNRNQKYQVNSKKKMILLESKEESMLVDLEDILYVETQGRSLLLHTKKRVFSDINMTLEDVIRAANSSFFVRCHKSFAINVNNVKWIKNVDRRLWCADFGYEPDFCCQISKTYYSDVYSLLMKK